MRKSENGGMVECGSVRIPSFLHFRDFALPYFHNSTFLKGSVLMETVIVMPIILLLIFMVIQFAHVWIARQMVVYAAYCGARSLLVIAPNDTDPTPREAVQTAAEIALSWICLADGGPSAAGERQLDVPGWGKIPGSGSASRRDGNWRVKAEILDYEDPNGVRRYLDGNGTPKEMRYLDAYTVDTGNDDMPFVAVKVTFRFPLLIPGMGVNAILGNQANGNRDGERPTTGEKEYDFYRNLATMADNPILIDGWPYITFSETCVLPMPYSTRNFPKGGYAGTIYTPIKTGGGS